MAEALGLTASIIAVVQLAGRIAAVCKVFLDKTQDCPRDLRLIYVETGSLKVIFEGLSFLDDKNPADSTTLRALQGDHGVLERCKHAVTELDRLFPPLPALTALKRKRSKKETLQMALGILAWPLKAEKAMKLLDEIMRYKSTIGMALQGQLLNDVRNMGRQLAGITKALTASEKRGVVDWFRGPVPFSASPHTLHNTAKGLYEDKTGDWVLATPEWANWINCRERALWIHGIPGAGKTVLASHVIEKTRNICETRGKKTRLVYYYCHHSHNQDETAPFLRWLVSELLQGLDEIPSIAWEPYERRTEPDLPRLLQILGEALHGFERVYVGIDALDESESRANLLALLERLTIETRFAKIQLFATSREYEDIRRKMSSISQPLSMSNPFVEADIRLYVAAKIRENPRFHCWPENLRTEVEDVLSTGAKGMFRWAVCQLDILRRLHHQSKVREAIRSLPETLDETYERIFSCIAEENRGLVRCAIHLLCFHNFLWEGSRPLPAHVLLEFYPLLNESDNRSGPDDCFLDLANLKDVCGCLVAFSYGRGGETANVAHYTVREFLESSRASSPLTASMKIGQKDRFTILVSVFQYAIRWIEDEDNYDEDDNEPLAISATSNLGQYCLASSVWSFGTCEELVEPSLAFKLLDPSRAHYKNFQRALERQESHETWFSDWFWMIYWADGCKSSKAAILISLLIMDCFSLAKVFVKDLDMKGLMQEVLTGEISELWREKPPPGELVSEDRCVRVKGNLVDVLCGIQYFNRGTLGFLQEEASTLIDYGNLLSSYMLAHDCCRDLHQDDCVLEEVFRRGANPNPKESGVMPLQISVYRRDLAGVKSLLEHGADPNNTGDTQGIAGNNACLLIPINLHGVALVDILRNLKPPDYLNVFWIPEERQEMYHAELAIGKLLGISSPYGGSWQDSDQENEGVEC